jgi:serine/threonine protein kinase
MELLDPSLARPPLPAPLMNPAHPTMLAGRAAATHPHPPAHTATIGPWLIDELIAASQTCQIVRARPVGRDDRHARYALKVLLPTWQDHPGVLQQWYQAAHAGRRVKSPHVAPVLAAQLRQAPHYLVMPLLEGATIAAQLRSGPLEVGDALWLARQAAQGLAAMHAAGFAHGDLKPANLMVAPDGHLTILDLCSVQPLCGQSGAARAALHGTLPYLAPELLTTLATAGVRSDLYSLGATLFEMLAGRPPVEAATLAELVTRHRQQAVARLRTLVPHAPREVEWLVARLLARNPLRRPASAEEVVRLLVRLEIATLAGRFEA